MTIAIPHGQESLAKEVLEAPSGEGRWPRICDRACAIAAPRVRCAHVL